MGTFARASVCMILYVAASLCKIHGNSQEYTRNMIVLCVTLASSTEAHFIISFVALHESDQENEPSACDQYCVISMPLSNGQIDTEILQQGGSTQHPENPCTTYFC